MKQTEKPLKIDQIISQAEEDPVMRLAARYGTRETLQVDADGKTVPIRTIGFDEHSLRQFFEALKRGET